MHFQLPELTAVRCTNANPRTELHGKDENGDDNRVRGIDLAFVLTTENTVLDEIAPGLRAHFFRNKAADASQGSLPDVVIPLPNIRFPELGTEDIKWKAPKSRGYRWIWDWGREEQHVDLSDVAMGGISLTLHEGGTTDVKFSISYNGDELADNTLYGELCGLAAMGELHIQLFAPAEPVPVKKGWRSGKADEPQTTDGGAPLLEEADGDGEGAGPDGPLPDDQGGFAEGSPEAALLDSVQQQEPDPFAMPAKRGRGKRAAARASLQ